MISCRTRLLILVFLIDGSSSQAQVFNQGVDQAEFKNMLKNGITYVRTDDSLFDACIITSLERHWKHSSFDVIERWGHPDKSKTILFVTKKKPTRQYFEDRRNQKVLLLYPGSMYELKFEPNMERSFGYIFFNGFFDLMSEDKEYLFANMMIGSLSAGIACIRDHSLPDVGTTLNTSISSTIIKESGTPVGNTLLIHREQATKYIDMKLVEKSAIRHRLVGVDEYYKLVESVNEDYHALFFAENEFAELSIIQIKTGKIIFTRHLHEDHPKLTAREVKEISRYFH